MLGRIAIGMITDSYVNRETVSCLLRLERQRHDRLGGFIDAYGDVGHLDIGRNRVISNFLSTDNEWLLWVDSDMVFTPTDFDALTFRAQQGWNITSALYVRDTDPPTPCAFRYVQEEDRIHSRVVELPAKDKVMKVDAVGFGFVLMHRDVFTKIATKAFNPARLWCDNSVVGPHGQPLSEDMSFCLRAKDVGFDIALDTAVRVGHVKTRVLYP